MSEKTTEWRVVQAPGLHGKPIAAKGEPAPGIDIRNLQGMCELANTLTSERDEAVRVAGELRALAEKMAPHIVAFRTDTDVIHAYGHASHPIAETVQCSICCLRAEVDALLDSLTASTGGSSDEPQKEKSPVHEEG